MKKELSIVRVDTRNHRAIARENWGLTKEQMKGKHVHHRISISRGGTNDPSNLYVCGPWFHKNVWHAEDGYNSLIPHAAIGGRKGGLVSGPKNGRIAAESGQLAQARTIESIRKGGFAAGRIAAESGQLARTSRKAGIVSGYTKWCDPNHPEIGVHNAGNLVRKQRALGYPSGKENRVRVG